MTGVGIALRWLHLASLLLLLGHLAATLLVGRSDRASVRAWDRRTLERARWLAALVLCSGIATLAHQTALVEGRAGAAVDVEAWARVLAATRFGTVWLVRHAVLLLLAAFVLFRGQERSAADWIAFRLEAILLATAGAAGLAWAGHAAAVGPGAAAAMLSDALHVIAAGLWLGALPALAAFLRLGSTEAGAEARPFAVLAVRRFSAGALATMALLIATGLWNAWTQVGDLPGLIGTRYGILLLAKLALVVPLLALALANRRLLPALAGDAATVGRPALARIASGVTTEWALGLVVLLVAATLSFTPPARHESPWWPLPFRLSWEATADLPGAKARLLIGSQLVLIGCLALIVSRLLRRARGILAATGAAAAAVGLMVALPPLSVDAYPTTYRRSWAPYEARSIADGLDLFRAHCIPCHGPEGRGDGPDAAGLARRPADLTAPHTNQHTAGDLFWWISHGIPRGGMPGFADRLHEEERWDLINFLRALSAGERARRLGPAIEPDRPWLAAPDFLYAVGPGPVQALKELRGRRMVLLVLFGLPGSRDRLAVLAAGHQRLVERGVEILAVPTDGGPEILTRLGASPRILFPVATEGGVEIGRAYGLFAGVSGPAPAGRAGAPAHAEFLIDRQGYVRARWVGGPGGGWDDLDRLVAQIEALGRERPTAPPPDEHVH